MANVLLILIIAGACYFRLLKNVKSYGAFLFFFFHANGAFLRFYPVAFFELRP
jgi:hypothetical protein